MPRRYKGFTLIELLVVIGILGILLAIVLIAINPARQFAQADNVKRESDANTLLNAIHQYYADNRGVLPPGMPAKAAAGVTAPTTIADGAVEISNAAGGPAVANICAIISPTYVSALPVDPQTDNGSGKGVAITDCNEVGYHTNYAVFVDSAGRVTVTALGTDTTSDTTRTGPIQITR